MNAVGEMYRDGVSPERGIHMKKRIPAFLLAVIMVFAFTAADAGAAAAPAKVTGLRATAAGTMTTLKWNKARNARTYRVYNVASYRKSGRTKYRYFYLGTTRSTSVRVGGLKKGYIYKFTVRAFNGKKAGPLSRVISVKAKAAAKKKTSAAAKASAKSRTSTKSKKAKVIYDTSGARSMLAMINKFRTGKEAWALRPDNKSRVYYKNLKKLKYDTNLEKVAKLRAVEISKKFSHTRPNGRSCFTAYDQYKIRYMKAGENLAMGFRTAASVMDGWKETKCKYNYQGHRRAMLDRDFTRVGIAHVRISGRDYWVQEFAMY